VEAESSDAESATTSKGEKEDKMQPTPPESVADSWEKTSAVNSEDNDKEKEEEDETKEAETKKEN